MASKSSKNTQSVPSESTPNHGWIYKHPNIQDSFYQKIEPPVGLEDAHIKMSCHQHAIDDFNLQMQMNDIELSMLLDREEEVLPYHESKAEELENKKLKLLLGKRFHQNAARSYWYYMAMVEK
jgi:hypothetical protein